MALNLTAMAKRQIFISLEIKFRIRFNGSNEGKRSTSWFLKRDFFPLADIKTENFSNNVLSHEMNSTKWE